MEQGKALVARPGPPRRAREADQKPTYDAATSKRIQTEEAQQIKTDLHYAFEQLTKAAALCTPHFHARLQNIELGGQIDLRRLSYEDLATLVPILRKAQALTIEQRSESGADGDADERREDNGGDGR